VIELTKKVGQTRMKPLRERIFSKVTDKADHRLALSRTIDLLHRRMQAIAQDTDNRRQLDHSMVDQKLALKEVNLMWKLLLRNLDQDLQLEVQEDSLACKGSLES
jgi:hypothetical protein